MIQSCFVPACPEILKSQFSSTRSPYIVAVEVHFRICGLHRIQTLGVDYKQVHCPFEMGGGGRGRGFLGVECILKSAPEYIFPLWTSEFCMEKDIYMYI
jgi:hypothetical protein